MVLKKMDALEFVNSLNGGWNTVIFDPPYLNKENATGYKNNTENDEKRLLTKWNDYWDVRDEKIQQRLLIEKDYLDDLQKLILSKIKNGWWVEFSNRPLNYNYNVIWYKGKSYGGIGFRILRNCSHIGIKKIGKSDTKKNYGIKEVEEYKKDKKELANIPVALLMKLLTFTNAKYVLDPFGGTFSTAKACKRLQIKIDSCDKFRSPPDLLGLEKFGVK